MSAATLPPGDAGERARELLPARIWGNGKRPRYEDTVNAVAAALQSERTAAASQARRETMEECACLVENGAEYELTALVTRKSMAEAIRGLATPQEHKT